MHTAGNLQVISPHTLCAMMLFRKILITTTFMHAIPKTLPFLPCDASAERGNVTVSRLSVRPSVRDV